MDNKNILYVVLFLDINNINNMSHDVYVINLMYIIDNEH